MNMKRLFQLLLSVALVFPFCACEPKEEVKPEKPFLRLSTSEKTVTNRANSFTLYVESNVAWTAEAKSDWLSIDKTSGEGDAMITVGYQASTVDRRSGVVRFTTEGLNPVELVVTQTELLFTNPIGTIPDPWIVKYEGMYYTCWASGNGIKVSRSDKLSVINGADARVWNCPKDLGDNKVWNPTNVWAPELHRVDGRWYIYYAAGRPTSESNGSYTNQRSGVLRAKTDDPLGEWEDMGMLYTGDHYEEGIVPTLENTNYAIDLGVFYLNGQLYAVWSGNPVGSGDQHLYIATMENPYTISSSRVEISKPDMPWELRTGHVNEGPAFLRNKEHNKFFVIYSCNGSWTKEYALAYVALNDTTLDPMNGRNWKKSPQPVFTRCDNKTPGVNGVGHCSFTKSPDDAEDWIVYHAKNSEQDGWSAGGGRSTFIKKFTWNEDGTPNFGEPVGYGEESELPSGETGDN